MKRILESLPDPEEMARCGLKRGDFRVDAETYRYFADRYRREWTDFAARFRSEVPAGGTDADAGDEACRRAFEASLPPYHYRRGLFYRCRADCNAGPDGPLLLVGYDREEITGWVGIPPGPRHRDALADLLGRIEDWLSGGRRRRREAGKEPTRR